MEDRRRRLLFPVRPRSRVFARSIGSFESWKREPAVTSASSTVMPSTPERTGFPQSPRLATRRAADNGRAFRTGEDAGLYARFRWEYARHDPHKPHRDVALRALRFAHEVSSVPLHQHSSNKSSLDGRKDYPPPDLAILVCF